MTGRVYIVEEGPNPSTDYFVLPAVKETVLRCTWHDLPSPSDLDGSTVIFVRYIPLNWRKLITATRSSLNKLIYFMDDDLFDTKVSAGQSWRYRYKLAHLAAWQQNWLKSMQAEYWVSTNWLQQKYKQLTPKLILPRPISIKTNSCKVFYHGSASHKDEIEWLHPIIQTVLKKNQNISFEIIGNDEINRMYRNLPRVNIVHPMKWPSYQAFINMPGRHIGLAPLLDNPFNLSRSYTKFFDITQAGAAGIYAQSGAWNTILTDQEHGFLIEMNPASWVRAILQLSNNDELRNQIIQNAQIKMNKLKTR